MMTPEQLVEQLKQALPAGLRAVVLYGSAAAGDHLAGKSDYNVLVVADRLGLNELDALAKPAAAWAKAGNRPPLLFTAAELAASADSFPIELLDMQQSRKVLFGDDLLANVKIRPEHLRLQLERDWKAKVLQVREHYLLTGGKPKPVVALMTGSLSTFLVLCRAALRLYRADVPVKKLDALRALAEQIGFDPAVFVTIHELKEGRRKVRDVSPASLCATYLKTIGQIGDAVERCCISQS
jgi:predicted nucleotidyltransferase